VFSVQSGICKVVPVCAMQAFRVVEVQLHIQPQHYSKWTWMVCFIPGHPHALWTGGWVGTRTGMGTLE